MYVAFFFRPRSRHLFMKSARYSPLYITPTPWLDSCRLCVVWVKYIDPVSLAPVQSRCCASLPSCSHIINQNGASPGIEMCFWHRISARFGAGCCAISAHFVGGRNTSWIQHKEVYPLFESSRKKFSQLIHLIHVWCDVTWGPAVPACVLYG